MSTRFGMADGRCLTVNESNQLMQENIAKSMGVNPLDSGLFRERLQKIESISIPPQSSPCGIINYR